MVACAVLVAWSVPAGAALMQDESPAEMEATDAPPTPGEATEEVNGIADLISTYGTVFTDTPRLGWLLLFTCILVGLIAGKIVQSILRRAGERWKEKGWEVGGCFFDNMASPSSLVLLTIGITIGLQGIKMPPELNAFTWNMTKLLYIVAIGWFVFNLIDLVDMGLRRVTNAETNKLSAQLVPLIRKALRIFVVIVFMLFIAQNVFHVNITAWLAGLGIAGLAISLASQDSIRNLFGSVTVMLDKPFVVGDRIVFSGVEGFVEEIGFRSTRIRTFAGHLVTLPNMRFIDGSVENVSRRSFLRRGLNVTITYDTPSPKIDEALQIIKDLLAAEDMAAPFRSAERPPRVYFNEFNADSLNISVSYWYFLDAEKGHDWWHYQEHAELFNKRLFAAFGEAGIEFAFPTQTLYLAGDPSRQLTVQTTTAPASGQGE